MISRAMWLLSMCIRIILICGVLLQVATAQETDTPTATWTATFTWTPTATSTPTATWTATATWTPTWTPIVQTVVVTQPAIVITQPPLILTSAPIVLTAAPVAPVIAPVQPLALTTQRPAAPAPTLMTPFYGWKRYQSIYFIQVIGNWAIQNDASASAQQYRISSSARATARYPFTGDGVRLAYQASPQGCLFDLVVDTRVVASIDSHADAAEWRMAGPYFLSSGYHVLDIRSQAQESGVCAVAFDYIEVFSNPPMPTGAVGSPNSVGSASLTDIPRQDVAQIVLVSQPPTPMPTVTVRPVSMVSLTVQVAYDTNANSQSDLGEGIQGLSIRILNAVTGELLYSGFTDDRGVARFQVVSSDEVLATIPLLGRTFTIRPALGRTTTQTWDVRLEAANQPAVIP